MAKSQKKTGKGRLDKYYKLAKEQGYRARSAFKLIQLNKKYAFLESARCCIDLCAAPGGWLQVASKYMPVNSIIVGVDLVPIKPIPRVITFASDITTPQCRSLLRNELKDWKADVVLHDGAPNVGTAWVQDAYTQSELVLMSLKLAVEFLIKGGTFVTKVFRSVDYNNLIWVFSQLFTKVEATKPPSSRNVSAEIFVVCRDFLAPKHIDPKFLDPRHVFKELTSSIPNDAGISANNVQANVFHPEKKRRKREGYADGDYTLYKTVGAADYIRCSDPVAVLGSFNKITFLTEEEKSWLSMDVTTADVKPNCDDLKVLGKGDFKTLIKWRLALRQELGLDVNTKDADEFTEFIEVTGEVDEEQQIQEELERLNKEATARAKRERRRANELRTRTIQRMQLQMTAPLDVGLEQQDAALGIGQDDVFDFSDIKKNALYEKGGVSLLTLEDGDMDGDSEADDEKQCEDDVSDVEGVTEDERTNGLEAELDGMYDAFKTRLRERDAKFKVEEMRKQNAEREEWHGIQGSNSDEDTDGSAIERSDEKGWNALEQAKFAIIGNSSDDSSVDEDPKNLPGKKRALPRNSPSNPSKRRRLGSGIGSFVTGASKTTQLWFSQNIFANEEDNLESNSETSSNFDSAQPRYNQSVDQLSSAEDSDNLEVVPQDFENAEDMWDIDNDNEDKIKQKKIQDLGLLTPEAVTLAQQLVNRQTTKTQLINDGFNRYALNSKEGLPSWFLDDEAKYYKSNIPITKEAVATLRAKQRALDARPIKKIAEAKARKKLKAAQRLENAMKKAEGVNETTDMTEREKAQQIEKLMRKGHAKGKKKEVKLVVAKGPHRGIKGRPKGVKGRYTMVDARMKKEVR
ncbi:hypothetical protein AMATHDRAFT_130 [Amanita thiersii Skay4041]|uniref:Uncharacterized protein n=1 Tax=Amanita thiersii Skay4041 TaxID=703135 RepID=A0A2A9P0H2_9AGAR|nr:hypothetical protein AMATHDRAFT_130 [Amanita thiersii Skay4041]